MPNPRKTAEKIASMILDYGLANSTWRDENSAAYNDLLAYREEITLDALHVLEGKKVPPSE